MTRAAETRVRAIIRAQLNRRGIRVNSVSYLDREDSAEFAVIVVPREFPDAYALVAEYVTNPSFPFRVTRERAGQRDDFIYLAPSTGKA
jgi:hypothetical protein